MNRVDLYSSRAAFEAPLGVFGIHDIRRKNYRDTGYLRKKVIVGILQDIEK